MGRDRHRPRRPQDTEKEMIIGIEGPAGAGKSTMANTVAIELGARVIEGGAWYRALTYLALQSGVDLQDTDELVKLATDLDLKIIPQKGAKNRLELAGQDVTAAIYTEDVSVNVSIVAGQLPVREKIERKIVEAARVPGLSIVVGRHLRKALPEAHILRITISDEEADRRHLLRSGQAAQSVQARNREDVEIGKKLGITDMDNVTLLDVSDLSETEQADALRLFIERASTPKL